MAKQANGDGPKATAYPYYSWTKCLDTAAVVMRLGGDRSDVGRDVLAHEMELADDSSVLSQLVSSAKCFGMLEGRGSYRLTKMGSQYFLPTTENETRQAALGFFASPAAFSALIERFDGNTLPSSTTLQNILYKHGSVPESWKERVVAIFMDAAAILNIIDAGGRLRYSVAVHEAKKDGGAPAVSPPATGHRQEEELPHPAAPPGFTPAPDPPSVMNPLVLAVSRTSNTWVFTEAKATIRLETPDPMPPALWEKLRGYVELLKPADEREKGANHEEG